jgi:hypothetical protein
MMLHPFAAEPRRRDQELELSRPGPRLLAKSVDQSTTEWT